jgi:hypothetical protein
MAWLAEYNLEEGIGMSRRIRLRKVEFGELNELLRLSQQTENPKIARRAKLLLAIHENPRVSPTRAAYELGWSNTTCAVTWVKRFNENGVDILRHNINFQGKID